MTLHVVNGRLCELEIWDGTYGHAFYPDVTTLEYVD
jgi:hypothetical protein